MLSKLTLIITHQCNLRCTYCYAQGGNYGLSIESMSKNLAIDIVNHFENYSNGINEIFFFGGEPLLAIETIEAVCNHLKNLFKDKKISHMPTFSLVTNGTKISKHFAKLAQNYNFGITISIDGPSDIHNFHRKTNTGQNSFAAIMKGIQLLNDYNVPFSIECTYTIDHWKNGYNILDIYRYLQSFNPNHIIISEELGFETLSENDESLIDYKHKLYLASIDLLNYSLNECISCDKLQHSGLIRMYESIIRKPELIKHRFCGAGINNIAVNPLGITYPCHMLNNQSEFNLGYYKDIRLPVDVIPQKNNFKNCSSCPIKELCRACPAKMYFYHGRKQISPIESDCETIMSSYCLAINSLSCK